MIASEPSPTPARARHIATLLALFLTLTLASGCNGLQTRSEITERERAKLVTSSYRPGGSRPQLAVPTPGTPWAEYVKFAILNTPKVEAAYYDWMAAVARITLERSLPDPRLTFQMDIASTVASLMPGLMVDLPGPGKLGLKADAASAESQAKFAAFQTAILETAYEVKRTFLESRLLEERIRVNRETLLVLEDLESAARKQNEVGRATLQDVLRAQIEHDRLTTEIANLEQFRVPLSAQFKAALGLPQTAPEVPLPTAVEPDQGGLPDPENLLAEAFARNPRLKGMEAEIRQTEVAIALARKSRVPDMSLGLEADPLAGPTMFRPQLGLTLPIWKDKLRAELLNARAASQAARARLAAERVQTGVELAGKSYMYREAARDLDLAQNILLPKARLSLEVARSAYMAGKIDFLNVMDAWRGVLSLELEAVAARTRHSLVLAEISLLIAGIPPAGATDWLQAPTPATEGKHDNSPAH